MGITWVKVLNKVHRFREFLSRSDDGQLSRLLTNGDRDTEDTSKWFKGKGFFGNIAAGKGRVGPFGP
jgi:hypothetical protein